MIASKIPKDAGMNKLLKVEVKRKLRWWPRYVVLPVGSAILGIILTINIFVFGGFYYYNLPDWAEISLVLCGAMFATGILYSLIFTPLHASGDRHLRYKKTPQITAKSYSQIPRNAVLIVIVAGGIIAVRYFYFLVFLRHRFHEIDFAVYTWPILLIGGLVLLPLTVKYEKWLLERFKARFWERNICFKCNYDLRGNSVAVECPECGAKIVRLKDGE